jgi:hypothetical protein
MDSDLLRRIKLCGTEEPDAASRTLRADPLSAELENGNLRYVRFAGTEVLRAISFLVRDENWGTFTPEIADLEVREDAGSFVVSYRGLCANAKQRLGYEARIEGRSNGALDFQAFVLPETDVATNRAGFVVLHPLAGVAGRPVRVVHTDGSEATDTFPALIKPSQPIFHIRSLAHEIAPGVWATCTMEGDAFEMEDQRNWSDASYKTYIRPLAKPVPYVLNKGSRHIQRVRLSISGAALRPPPGDAGEVEVSVGRETGGTLPLLGIGVPADEAVHALEATALMQRLSPRVLVCHVDARSLDRARLEAYRRLVEVSGAESVLEIVIPGEKDPEIELKPVAAAARDARLEPAAVMVFPASDLMSHQPGHEDQNVPPAAAIAAAARAAFPRARLGGGMGSYFTELNRKRPLVPHLDFVTHTTCPIVHAADDRSVMESLEALPAIIASTRALSGTLPYRVGPSAIGCRQNPYGKDAADNPRGGRVCLARIDPRQRGLFAAAWTLGYFAAFARGAAEAVTLGAPTGPFGFIYRRNDYPQPYYDTLGGPSVYPAFHVMAGLARDSGRPIVEAQSSRPHAVEALAYRTDGRSVLWLANLTAVPTVVALSGQSAKGASAAVIDAASFERVTTDPHAPAIARPLSGGRLELDAYAVALVETAA